MRLEMTILWVLLCALFCVIGEVSCQEEDVPPPCKHDGKYAMAGAGISNSMSPVDNEPLWELSGLHEGDILLPDSTFGRNALRDRRFRWPYGVIPYYIKPGFDSICSDLLSDVTNAGCDADFENKRAIIQAMRHINDLTCITFRAYTNGDPDWITITNENYGCWSLVGKQSGGQHINLGNGCVTRSTVVHELLHAIGFLHQQSASDRDNFVIIKWENIRSGLETNFQKYSASFVTSFGVPYDYGSIMHYGPYAFSKNSEPTIVAKYGNPRIGPGDGMTHSDVRKVRHMYRCDQKPRHRKKKCQLKWMSWWWWLVPLFSSPQRSPEQSSFQQSRANTSTQHSLPDTSTQHSLPDTSTQHSRPNSTTQQNESSIKSPATRTSRFSRYSVLSLALSTAVWASYIVH